jgi:alkylation response protein AidB-like acyl-CoA dehydrogenase
MFNLQLTQEQIEFRDTVRDFVRDVVKPAILDPVRLQELPLRFPADILEETARLGLRSLRLSESAGGAGADELTSCMVLEELGAGDAGIALTIGETARLARILFDDAMTPDQRDIFLPRFVEDASFHLSVATPSLASDLGLGYYRPGPLSEPVAVNAVRDGGGWLLNGSADFVLNAPLAGLFAVCVDGVTEANGGVAFLVPRDADGLEVTGYEASESGMPWYLGLRGRLIFRNCRVAESMSLGEQGYALLHDDAAGGGRIDPWQQAINLGLGRAACEAALEYTKIRVQGARSIIGHQAIGIKLADMAIRTEVARTMIWRAACAFDRPGIHELTGHPVFPLWAISKVYASEAMHEVAELAAECFGAMGVMRDMPLQKYFNEATILLGSGCSNSTARFRIAEALAGYEGHNKADQAGM